MKRDAGDNDRRWFNGCLPLGGAFTQPAPLPIQSSHPASVSAKGFLS